jgi:uncharacterized protein (TIGR02611 family)
MAGEPEEHRHPSLDALREAGMEAEMETGRREETVEEARASIHVRLARIGVGYLVLLAGIAMLALPGPGWITIAVGLGILSRDVAWAGRALERVRQRIPETDEGDVHPGVIVLSVLTLCAGIAGSVWWYVGR